MKTLTHNNHNAKKSITRDINNTQKTAEAFNQYFSTIAEQLIKEATKENSNKGIDPLTYLRLNINKPNNMLRLKNTTTHEICKIIRTLKTKDSYGYVGISTRILKINAPYVVSPLTYITNKILSSGIFPDRLTLSPP